MGEWWSTKAGYRPIEYRGNNPSFKPARAKMLERVDSMFREGLTPLEISYECGMTERTVYRWLEEIKCRKIGTRITTS